MRARDVAELILLVLDQSAPLTCDDERLLASTSGQPRIVVLNKSDREIEAGFRPPAVDVVVMSAKTGAGFDELRRAMVRELAGTESLRDAAVLSNTRHIALLEAAHARLTSALYAADTGATPEEFVLSDLQAARQCFDEIVGVRTPETVLEHIFERFCIGK